MKVIRAAVMPPSSWRKDAVLLARKSPLKRRREIEACHRLADLGERLGLAVVGCVTEVVEVLEGVPS